MKKLLLLSPLILCLSCFILCLSYFKPQTQSEADANTKGNFLSPQMVGTLPDGRVVKSVVRDLPEGYDHHIYFIDNTITVNHTQNVGKTTTNRVEVFIDGVKLVPVEEQ